MSKSLRSTTALAVLLLVLAGPDGVRAQLYPDGALGSLYLSEVPTGYDGVVPRPSFATPFQFYLVADIDFGDIGRPEQNFSNGMLAWDGRVVVPSEMTVIGFSLSPRTSVDIGAKSNPVFDFIVGTGQRVPVGQPYPLVTIEAIILVPPVDDIFVRTLSPALASVPNAAAWVEFSALNGCEASPGRPTPCLFPFAQLGDLRIPSGGMDTIERWLDVDPISVVCDGSSTTVEIGIFEMSGLEFPARPDDSDLAVQRTQNVSSFGFEVGIPAGFQLTGWRPGGLTEGWAELDCVQTSETTVRIDGSATNAFGRRAIDSYFAHLTFEVPCEAPGTTFDICVTRIFYGLSFYGIYCSPMTYVEVGDVDANGAVGTGDAQCAFTGWLSDRRPACARLGGWPASADVDCNGAVTPRDALCIFRSWLDGSCTFCTPDGGALARANVPVLEHELVDRGDGWEFTVRTTSALALQAWGLDFEGLAALGEPDFVEFGHEGAGGEVVVSGWDAGEDRLRIGAITREAVTVEGIVLRAVWSKASRPDIDPDAIRLIGSSDDLAGATSSAFTQTPPPVALERTVIEVSPNPFNPRTTIRVYVPANVGGGEPLLGVHDARGRLVRRLPLDTVPGAWSSVVWDGRDDTGKDVASGMYFVRLDGLDTPDGTVVSKLTLVR